jgi:hypothetical protein
VGGLQVATPTRCYTLTGVPCAIINFMTIMPCGSSLRQKRGPLGSQVLAMRSANPFVLLCALQVGGTVARKKCFPGSVELASVLLTQGVAIACAGASGLLFQASVMKLTL